MPILGEVPASDYRILVCRGTRRPRASLYAFGVRQPISTFPLPLFPGDPEPETDLGAILHGLYERARYDLRLDYGQPAAPPLIEDDAAWAATLVANRK